MRERELFDKVRFAKGDKLRRKFREKEDNNKYEVVDRSIEVTNVDGFKYLVIYFESNPKSPFVSAEFEPYDKNERKAYYEHWEEANSLLNEAKAKATKKSNNRSKVLKFKKND